MTAEYNRPREKRDNSGDSGRSFGGGTEGSVPARNPIVRPEGTGFPSPPRGPQSSNYQQEMPGNDTRGDIGADRTDQAPSGELPLSKYTHTKIVHTLTALVAPNIGHDLTPGEINGYEVAVEAGLLDDDIVVGREVSLFSELDCDNIHNRPAAVLTTLMTFNESIGLSDYNDGERVLARIIHGIDFDSGDPNERNAFISLNVREDSTVSFAFVTHGKTDHETTLAMEEEISEFGLDVDFDNDPRKSENGLLAVSGEFNEQQGLRLLRTLRSQVKEHQYNRESSVTEKETQDRSAEFLDDSDTPDTTVFERYGVADDIDSLPPKKLPPPEIEE